MPPCLPSRSGGGGRRWIVLRLRGIILRRTAPMPDSITVIRESERPVVDFPGGATYRTLIGDDNGAGIPIRTGIQTSEPGYATRLHSHPYVEVLTVVSGR